MMMIMFMKAYSHLVVEEVIRKWHVLYSICELSSFFRILLSVAVVHGYDQNKQKGSDVVYVFTVVYYYKFNFVVFLLLLDNELR